MTIKKMTKTQENVIKNSKKCNMILKRMKNIYGIIITLGYVNR